MSILHYSNLDVNEVDDLIGQNVNINGYDFVIGHIVDTDYEEYLYLVNDSFNYYDNDELEFKVKHQYTTVYMLPSDFESSKISQRVSTVMINDTEVEIYNASVFNPGWLDQDFPTETNEIAISYGYIINNNLVNDNNYASIIGSTVNINYFDEDTGIFTKNYLIVGTYDSYLNDIVLSETEYYNVANDYGIDSQPNSEYIHFQIGNESETKEVVKYLYDSNLLTQNIAWEGYQFSQQFSNDIAIISLIVGLILFILAAGMIGHFITIFIIDNKEITGILLALGASKQKIYKLYLWRSLIQIIVVVVTVIPILFLANGAMNNFILQFDTGIKIFYVNYVAVIMVFILCLILYFSCTLIPLSKFFKKDINNLIYNRV
jgi:ABC-type antimicrobial peptide transport system permease subunit